MRSFIDIIENSGNRFNPKPPRYLWHTSPTSNRQSILIHGLKPAEEDDEKASSHEIYFTTHLSDEDYSDVMDRWFVDTQGLDLEIDETTPPPPPALWFVTYAPFVDPSRLTMFHGPVTSAEKAFVESHGTHHANISYWADYDDDWWEDRDGWFRKHGYPEP